MRGNPERIKRESTTGIVRRRMQRLLHGASLLEVAYPTLVGGYCVVFVAAAWVSITDPRALMGWIPAGVEGLVGPVLAVVALLGGVDGYREFRRAVWRCDLSYQHTALLEEYRYYERMVADEDLLNLSEKAGKLARMYTMSDRRMKGFLDAYRQLLDHYPRLVATGEAGFYIERMSKQADKGLRGASQEVPERRKDGSR